jgi:hypothetical protein
MPVITVDFTQAQEFEPLPRGWYVVEVTDAQPGMSRAGQPKLTLRYRVIEPSEYAGRRLTDDLPLAGHPLGIGRTRSALRSMLGEDSVPEQGQIDTDDLVGATLRVLVTHRIWAEEAGGDGSVRAAVSRYAPLEGAELEIVDLEGFDDGLGI